MHHFAYRAGVLHAEDVALDRLAAEVGTPFYCYSTATLTRHYKVFAGAFADVRALVCYAMKANSNQAVIATLARLGAGADVVSLGELKRARLAGVPPERIMFSGIGKTVDELAAAVDEGILCVNVESEPELALLSKIAAAKGRTVCVSIRVNPDIDARTHAKIATGKSENKFGIPISRARDVYTQAAKLKGLRVAGVDMHIGSQITKLEPFDDAFVLLSDFVRTLRADGHHIEHVDLGGGLGIPYHDDNEPPPDLRVRRFPGARPRSGGTGARGPRCPDVGRRLRRGAGRHLQHPRARPGSVGERRGLGPGTAPHRGRHAHFARQAAALADQQYPVKRRISAFPGCHHGFRNGFRMLYCCDAKRVRDSSEN